MIGRIPCGRVRLVTVLAASAACAVVGCGGGTRAGSNVEASSPPKGIPADGKCPSAAEIKKPWRSIAAGPTIDIVTMVAPTTVSVPDGATTLSGPVKEPVKILMAIETAPSSRVSISGKPTSGDGEIRFAYFAETADWNDAKPVDSGTLDDPPRTSREGGSGAKPIELPGYMFVSELGCYEVTVKVDDQSFGPFGIGFGPAEPSAS